jgi:hypothetical protein
MKFYVENCCDPLKRSNTRLNSNVTESYEMTFRYTITNNYTNLSHLHIVYHSHIHRFIGLPEDLLSLRSPYSC